MEKKSQICAISDWRMTKKAGLLTMTITRIERKGMVNVLTVKTFIKSLKIPFSLELVFFCLFWNSYKRNDGIALALRPSDLTFLLSVFDWENLVHKHKIKLGKLYLVRQTTAYGKNWAIRKSRSFHFSDRTISSSFRAELGKI